MKALKFVKLLNVLESLFDGTGLRHSEKGNAANYANYQQGVTFLSIRASVHCSIALVDFWIIGFFV